MRSSTVAIVALLGLLAAMPLPAAAQTGWYLMSDGEDGEVKYVREILLAAGTVKELPRHPTAPWVVYDLEQREITVVDPGRRVYARASAAEHCRSLAQAQTALEGWASAGPDSGSATTVAAPTVTVRERRATRTRVQDFEEMLYEIRADDRWFERVWLSTDGRLLDALGGAAGLAAYIDMKDEFDSCSSAMLRDAVDATADWARILVESSPVYLEVMRKGWPLSASWNLGDRQVTEEVTIAAEWKVAAADLEPPDSYRHLALAELFRR